VLQEALRFYSNNSSKQLFYKINPIGSIYSKYERLKYWFSIISDWGFVLGPAVYNSKLLSYL